jgi:hypothetical protein
MSGKVKKVEQEESKIEIKFDRGSDYVSFEVDPESVAKYYGVFSTEVNEPELRKYLEENIKNWLGNNWQELDALPEGHSVYLWSAEDGDYIAACAWGKCRVYKITNGCTKEDVFMSLTEVFFSGCGVSVILQNDAYDYYSIVEEDGTILTHDDKRYKEILERIIKCEEYEVSPMTSC